MKRTRVLAFFVFVCLSAALFISLRLYEIELDHQSLVDNFIGCYKTPASNYSFPDIQNDRDMDERKKIFFLETSCSSDTNELSCRQACAVESAAKMNPNTLVYLLFINSSPPSECTNNIIKQILTYENVKVRRIYFDQYIKDTPIEGWFTTDLVEDGPWPPTDFADLLKLITVWKFGGTYIDFDVISTKSLEDLESFMVAEDKESISSEIFSFDLGDTGRKFSESSVLDIMENFQRYQDIGSGILTQVIKKLCGKKSIKGRLRMSCKDFTLLPPWSFSPNYHKEWEQFYVKENMAETMKRIERAGSFYFWNRLTASRILPNEDNVALTIIAKKYCPLTFNNCGSSFYS